MNSRLKSLAYRMLGSSADAEDVVQEAELRLHQAEPQPASREAFLYRVVSNLCVDRLRQEKTRRKHYFGPWLPEPFVDESADLLDFAEQLSMGFMLLLEKLSPAERAVYILREGFDFSYIEIADMLDISSANARQRAHRAKARLKSTASVPPTRAGEQKNLLEAMLLRVAERDVEGLVALMAEDAVVYADGGGIVSATIQPVYGRARIAQVTLHLAQKAQMEGDVGFEFVQMNGTWGLVITQNDAVHSCFQIEVRYGLIEAIYVMRNPEKLVGLTANKDKRHPS